MALSNTITSNNLAFEIEKMVANLLQMARDLTWNRISDKCKFILSEIKDGFENSLERIKFEKEENSRKNPVELQELVPELQRLYPNLYDINLSIYKATNHLTIIDIRYYPKSSLDEDYRQEIQDNPPILHCSVSLPPWTFEKKTNSILIGSTMKCILDGECFGRELN